MGEVSGALGAVVTGNVSPCMAEPVALVWAADLSVAICE